jgi:hypothetical protein
VSVFLLVESSSDDGGGDDGRDFGGEGPLANQLTRAT